MATLSFDNEKEAEQYAMLRNKNKAGGFDTQEEAIEYSNLKKKATGSVVATKPQSVSEKREKFYKQSGVLEEKKSNTFKDLIDTLTRPGKVAATAFTNAMSFDTLPNTEAEKRRLPQENIAGGFSGEEMVNKGAEAYGSLAGNLIQGEGIAKVISKVAPVVKAVTPKVVTRIGEALMRPVTNIKNWIQSDKFASKINGEFWAKEAAGNAKYGEILEKANPTTVIKTLGAEVVDNPEYLKEPTMKVLSELGDTASVKEVQTAINKINKYIPKTSYSVSARPEDIANMEVVHNLRTLLTDNVDELKAFKPIWAKNKEVFKKLSKFMTDIDKTEIGIRKGLNTGDTKAMKKMIDSYFDAETVRQLGGYSRIYRTVEALKKSAIPAAIGAGATGAYFGLKK